MGGPGPVALFAQLVIRLCTCNVVALNLVFFISAYFEHLFDMILYLMFCWAVNVHTSGAESSKIFGIYLLAEWLLQMAQLSEFETSVKTKMLFYIRLVSHWGLYLNDV